MYGGYPHLQTNLTSGSLNLLMETEVLAFDMGHDTVDSLHLVTAVMHTDDDRYRTAQKILSDLTVQPERLFNYTKTAFVAFKEMPDMKYQTDEFHRMCRLAKVFAELRRSANPLDTADVTTGDLVVAALESGSKKLERLLQPNYERTVERILEAC